MIGQPLSPIELSFWYQYKFNASSDANNIVHKVVIAKVLKKQVIERALTRLAVKHPALRANFHEKDGVPFRIINSEVKMAVIDGGGADHNEAEALINQPFLLEKDQLLRAILLGGDNNTTIIIACPHIIFDAVSWNIFLEDFLDALKGDVEGSAYELNYAQPDAEASNYWREILSEDGRIVFGGHIASLSNTDALGILNRDDLSSLFDRLIDLGRLHGVSMSSLCIALLSVVLYKVTDSPHMILSTPVTTRDDQSMGCIGSYINVLPIVLDIEKHSSFVSYLKSVAGRMWEAVDNRNFSLIDTLRNLPTGYHDDDQGIYNAMAEYVPYTPVDSLVLEDVVIPNKSPKLDFILSVVAGKSGHNLSIEYNAAKIAHSRIAQIVDVFVAVAEAILDDPVSYISEIPLTNPDSKNELLRIGAGPTRIIKPPFIWNRFTATTQEYPKRVAIREKDSSISYEELLSLSLRYASQLAAVGTVSGTVVGIYMDRGIDYIASMLAIWSLGAVYMPLDTKQPVQRLESMILKSGLSIVMTKERGIFDTDVTYCDIRDAKTSTIHLDSNYEPRPDDLAYIIFTSGSTGAPKGVMIEHQGFMNHLEIMIDNLGLIPDDTIAQTAPVSFDISVWQLVCALIVGASVRVVDYDDMVDPDRMYKLIKKERLSVLEVVPSLLSGYLSAEVSDNGLRNTLKTVRVITTGEAISGSIAKQWMTNYPNQVLLNAYGPAEASDDTHFFNIISSKVNPDISVPIGYPLLNIQTYIVTPDLQLCPKGMIGEICIGGLAVSRGYVGDSDLTLASFVPNPFITGSNERLYRTGDYGCWTDDGLLEYHGRRDHQVKVRGQRLELGEVEDHIKRVAGVKDAAVTTEQSVSGVRLKGYVIPEMTGVSGENIKAELRRELPDYMVPWKIVLVPDLPRSSNGKLDRKTLEKYSEEPSTQVHGDGRMSRTLRDIVDVYSTVLGLKVTPDANYFDCGGDSLQSMKIVAWLEKRHIHVAIRDILHYQTPRDLAAVIDAKRTTDIVAVRDWPVLQYDTPMQMHYLDTSGKAYSDTGEVQAAVITIGSVYKIDDSSLLVALRKITEAHASLKPTQLSAPTVVNQPEGMDSNSELVEYIRSKISLATPLIGCILHSNEGAKVLLVAHHFVLDFYSWEVIQKELRATLMGESLAPAENIVKQWWGKALNDLTADSRLLAVAKKTWRPERATLLEVNATKMTDNYTYKYNLPERAMHYLIRGNGISAESLVYQVLASAYMSATGSKTFLCNIEASLRSLDDIGLFVNSVGWMTYIFPLRIGLQGIEKDTLATTHKLVTAALEHGYEYGLLRYIICPKQYTGVIDSPWIINYLGKNTDSLTDIRIQKTLPTKERPFIEADISYSEGVLTFSFSHNTTLPPSYFEKLGKHLDSLVKDIKSIASRPQLSTSRQAAILKRLSHE